MKNKLRLLIIASLAAGVLSTAVNADFEKSKTYTDGQFTDVPSTEWYASSVKDAYEFGIMNGDSATIFNPDGTLTVAEGITIAARINETITGKAIEDVSGGEWYAKYVNYAIANGLMEEGQFDSYDINIKRFEIAELLSAAAGNLTAVNSVSSLPDVASGVDYADAVLKLYNAGVLTGNDSYGTFAPNSYLLRSEISAMAVRIADSEKRVQKTFDETGARAYTDAYYIIENVWGSNNGWTYDNRFDLYNKDGSTGNYINDQSDEEFFAFNRDFDPESEGILRLEIGGSYASNDKGAYIALENADEERIVELTPVNGVWTINGTTSAATTVPISAEKSDYYAFVIEVDLDNNTASAVINNVQSGTVSIKPDAVVERLVLGSNEVGKSNVQRDHTRMSKNYVLDENFFVTSDEIGQKPVQWDVTGDFAFDSIKSVLGQDIYSLKAETKAGAVSTASRSFTPITGKVVMETYVLFPEKSDGASVAFTSGGNEVFKFETKNGKIVMGDTELHDYTANVWQWLYVEADVETGKATVKINGKKKAEVDFAARVLDGVTVKYAPSADGVMWFDDVEVYNLIDHADYPSYPQVAESKDYNVGINVCFLWRDLQSGEGWDATSPFPEFDTYLGFYDEGLRETADWELKWMAEHGIDFMHVCWYCPYGNQTAPIKKMRVSHSALNDGYMNAKYSDLVDFCIMWENGGQDVKTFEQFKEFIWPYWKEYYFSDDRYVRLDNKALLTVWSLSNMKATFGGTNAGVKEAIDFMSDELKEMGYDGIIVLAAVQSENTEAYYKDLSEMGFDGSYGYHWNRLGYDGDYQIKCNDTNTKVSSTWAHHIPTISIGFNDVGRNDSRDPIVTAEDHLRVTEHCKEILDAKNTGTWKDNTVMISTWNEYSEGTYVMPTDETGFSYLENVRKVFTDDESDHTALDVKPTKTQIDRVGHLYAPNHSPIRWFQFEKEEGGDNVASVSSLEPVLSFDMSNGGQDSWDTGHGISDFKRENGVISGSSAQSDYSVATIADSFDGVNADDAPILHIRMKTSDTGDFEIYFATSSSSSLSQDKFKSVGITAKDEFVDYYVNMSTLGTWTDKITKLRIDPLSKPGSFEIALVELMGYKKNSVAEVNVNGTKLKFRFTPTATADGDYEVVGEARQGFYSSLRLYYEWDRFTDDGVLTLKTYDKHTYVLKVGSDKVTVDGTEKNLGFTFKLRDGLPVFHIKKLADLLGYKYTTEGAAVNIQAATDAEYEILENQVDNQWEFVSSTGTEGFTMQNGSAIIMDGKLCFTATGSDVAVMRAVDFKSTDYTHVVIGVECSETFRKGMMAQLFFKTKDSNSWTAEKVFNLESDEIKALCEGVEDGEIIELKFTLNGNSSWTGTITGLRFDPFSSTSDFKIDYFRCIKDGAFDDQAVENVLCEDLVWTFDEDGNKEGWSGQNSNVEAVGGYLAGTPTAADIAIVNNSVKFSANDAQVIVVGVKYDERFCSGNAELFFTTDSSNAYSADKCITAKYDIPDFVNPGETVEVKFDLSLNKKFYGTITGIRCDIHGGTFDYAVDYVKMYSIPGFSVEAPELVKNKAEMPTEAVIDDPENLPEGIKVSTANTGEISVVEDPENKNEKAFKVTCVKEGSEEYTYLQVYMNFVAGKKYKVSYKVYPLDNMNGDDISKTIIGGNIMYGTDGTNVKNHTFASAEDKSSGQGWVAISEEIVIENDYNPSKNDHFETWGKFSGGAGINYLVKDISITLAD